ncbi:MAG: bifunctional pyr operon transcriptional regulator/uracil phosphoribosyltransferase PyrR [Bacteroidota bacterium]
MEPITLLNSAQFNLTLNRLCQEIIEHYDTGEECVIIGLQPRGIQLGRRIVQHLENIESSLAIKYGEIDVSLYRDDFRRREVVTMKESKMDFIIEDKRVILVDDVLYTGRTIRAGLDAILDYGRPKEVQLLVLIDRRFSRQLPIEAKYIGKKVDSIASQKVSVEWKDSEGEDKVMLFTEKE